MPPRVHARAAGLIAAFLSIGAAPPPAKILARLDAGYLELVRGYARGQRPAALAAIGAWSERDLDKQVSVIEATQAAVERCRKCANPLRSVPLRAATLLHADRDQVDRPPPGREQTPRCPGAQARAARRYAAVLARQPEQRDFARRFFLASALRFQLEACFEDALRQAHAGLELFPRDGELLLAAGSVHEERAVLTTASVREDAVQVQQDWLIAARRELREAVDADPGQALAWVRLGRVSWRLGDKDAARRALEEGLRRVQEPGHRFLAHLFLGRVHEDQERLDLALPQYRRAHDLDPAAQSAAVALSHALALTGEPEEARRVLRGGLVDRPGRDVYWDYLVVNAQAVDALWSELHREAQE